MPAYSRGQPSEQRRQTQRVRPLPLLFAAISRVAPGAKPRVQKGLIRLGYQVLSARSRGDATFLNYGYAPRDQPRLDMQHIQSGEGDRYGAQLYYRVASAVRLRGKDVLEVGSGRGGGTAFVMAQFHPRTMTGVDFADRAISFCLDHYKVDGLSFIRGDAESLPFPPDSFDAVINVESSHCYPSLPTFLSEVWRVLRPAGHLLLADLRLQRDVGVLRDEILRAGFAILESDVITDGVVHALELDDQRRRTLIRQSIPRILRDASSEFLGVRGSRVYDQLLGGELEYVRFSLQKTDRL